MFYIQDQVMLEEIFLHLKEYAKFMF